MSGRRYTRVAIGLLRVRGQARAWRPPGWLAGAFELSYPTRQRLRHLGCASLCAVGGVFALLLAAVAQEHQWGVIVLVPLAAGAGWGWSAVLHLRLARRNRIGADSERRVRRVLKPLEQAGWRVAHSIPRPGGGDIDHLVIAPDGLLFVVETKTWRFEEEHLDRTLSASIWAERRYGARRALPVLCVTGGRGIQHLERRVLVTSLDGLVDVMRRAVDRSDDPG